MAYEVLPSYAHELYGSPVPLPEHVLRAVAGLGPGTRPSAYKPCRPAAILRAHGAQGEPRG